MFGFWKNSIYPIGIDIADDGLKIAQLKEGSEGLILYSAVSESCPVHIQVGSSDWQKWAIEALRKAAAKHKFHKKEIIAAIPPYDVFIDHIKLPKSENRNLDDIILAKIKQKLPFSPEQAMVKYIAAEEDNILVISTEREKINRYLAIYEKANLAIKSMGVWPVALANSYCRFFGRREVDLEAIVMLIDIGTNYTNIVICRHKNLMYARSVAIGIKQLKRNEDISQLVLEIDACRKQFASMYRKCQIERLVFISGQAVEKEICQKIAKKLRIAAHVGDCLSAVSMLRNGEVVLDRRNCHINWAIAFGLSLS